MNAAPHDPLSRHVLRLGSVEIPFSLARSQRKTVRIAVSPDRQVDVVAPSDWPLQRILDLVEKRGAWIVRQIEYLRTFCPLPTSRRYVSGETHYYLGRQYRLKIIRAEQDGVKLIRGYLRVFVHEPSDVARVRRLVDDWFNSHAREVIATRLEQCCALLQHFDVPRPQRTAFRRMKSRWGSCSKTGGILLNTQLAHVPVACIDYVITHELCHLKYPNHSRAFYELLSRVMPDWKNRKERLEKTMR
ncbi:MAG: M48 family metallopeptidase [Ignavibacteriales bacterium]